MLGTVGGRRRSKIRHLLLQLAETIELGIKSISRLQLHVRHVQLGLPSLQAVYFLLESSCDVAKLGVNIM